jgi:hypothetical protein
MNMTERRSFHRIPFDASTELSQGDDTWQVELLDISLKGLLVLAPADWNGMSTQPFHACITLSNEVNIRMDVQLVRSHAQQLGFSCLNIDVESISHLRRLVEINLGDERLIQRELAALSGA